MADAGFGIETPAQRFGLEFIPLVTERYFFLFRQHHENAAPIAPAMSILRSAELRRAINKLPGYDATHCGRVLDLDAAFPQLSAR
jgi:molybdate-binding protein